MAGTETRLKTMTTTLRLTPDERHALEVAASSSGVGPSTFARIATMRAAGKPVSAGRRRRSEIAQTVARSLGELGRIGGNVNQVARHVNRGGAPAVAELTAIRGELERMALALLALQEQPPE